MTYAEIADADPEDRLISLARAARELKLHGAHVADFLAAYGPPTSCGFVDAGDVLEFLGY